MGSDRRRARSHGRAYRRDGTTLCCAMTSSSPALPEATEAQLEYEHESETDRWVEYCAYLPVNANATDVPSVSPTMPLETYTGW